MGLKKPVVKSHGSSKPVTIAASIANAANIYRNNLVSAVEDLLKDVDLDALTENDNES